MTIRRTPLICDECSDEVVESFHAILGGTIYRLCSEACRSICRMRHVQPRPETVAEACTALTVCHEALPNMLCGAYGDEWG